MKQSRVNTDLISSTDFLPTICEAAGIVVPGSIDGVSFLPQLRGESGNPREWLYSWYSPRQKADMTVRECAFNQQFKLYRTGEFFDLTEDPDEQNAMEIRTLEGAAAASVSELKSVLDQFKDARPIELNQQFKQSGNANNSARKKKAE